MVLLLMRRKSSMPFIEKPMEILPLESKETENTIGNSSLRIMFLGIKRRKY
jgi:hypothetical protein